MSSVTEIENPEIKQEPIFSDCREDLCEDDALNKFTSASLILNVKTEPEELNESNENSTVEHFVVPVITKVKSHKVLHNNEDVTREQRCITKQPKSRGKHQITESGGKCKKQIENVPNTCTEDSSVENPSTSKTRRPRTRGPQRGRGVRVRGGKGLGGVSTLAVVKEVGTSSSNKRGGARCRGGRIIKSRGATHRAGSSCRGERAIKIGGASTRDGSSRGSRTMLGVHHVRSGPDSSDELLVKDISEMPMGQGLETPLHPKKRHTWPACNEEPASPPLPQSKILEASESLTEKSTITSSCSETSLPSLAMLIECKSSPLASSPIQNTYSRSRHVSDFTDFGSDSSSDDDGEDIYPALPVSRMFRSIQETPLDIDEAENLDIAGEPAIVGSSSATTVPPIMTAQPWRWYDFDWKPFPNVLIPPESRRERFAQNNVGPTTPHVDPYDIFVEIWDRQIMEHIVLETNKYAQEVASKMESNDSLRPTSRINRWRDTTVDELYVYFGIVLAMGIVVKSKIEEYWRNTPDIFYTPGFSAHMSINRFMLLGKCLHFNNNKEMRALKLSSSEARLHKIQPILSHINNKFETMYIPSQNIALDESLLQWKGCLDIGQRIPNKVAHRGIKTYEICESQTGYLWRFEVHAHKKSPPQQSEDPLDASTPSIVLRLVRGLENKGYTLWMDNFYNSPCLARRLKSLGFDCVGTLRTDRQFVPPFLHSLTKPNMSRGQIAGLTSGDVDVLVWRDSNRVAMISTYHGNAQQTQGGYTKPTLIYDYNIMMGGVDKKDQMLAMYPIERKRTKIWYKKLFRRLLNVSVLNSYIIHRRHGSLEHRNFRVALINSLLARHYSDSLAAVPKQMPVVDVTHRLAAYPFTNTQRQRRVCVSCKKRVQTFCVGCRKTVCIDPCFVTIHS